MPFPHASGNSRPSYWIETTPSTGHLPVASDEAVDVAIVGAGIAGVTAAYLLAKAGRSVIVVDRERLGMAETGHTTAHLQAVDDTRLSDLVPRFGLDGAKLVWDGHLEAIKTIEGIVEDNKVRCELERLDAWLYSPRRKDRKLLEEEARLARRIGYEAEYVEDPDLPFEAVGAVRFPDQGKFHVRKYLLGVAEAAQRAGARFHEGTEIVEVDGGKRVSLATRDGHTIAADWAVFATNTPFNARETIHTKLYPYRTYAIAARVPRDVFGEHLYWDTLDPYHYTRVERQGGTDLVIHGGEDHKVGTETDTEACHQKLIDHLSEATDHAIVEHRWSGEVLETEDDLPYVGRAPGRPENELIVTGDSGTGMTHGTLGALILTERILGRGTPWDELYDPLRVTQGKGALREWAKQNAHATGSLVGKLLMRSEIKDVAELGPGDGGILKRGLKPYAISRSETGKLRACSGLCTHMGCTVKWNHGEGSWDCPCHGSRFSPTGDVLHGPAVEPLASVDLDKVLGEEKQRTGPKQRT